MIDREKVINYAEETLTNVLPDEKDTSGIMVKVGWIREVLYLLKEQEAKSVKEQIWCDNKTRKEVKGICPWCNSVITHHSYGRFCDKCGKPVIWGRSVK